MTGPPPLPNRYVFHATNQAGRRTYAEAHAGNIKLARSHLELEGYRDLDLVQDEIDQVLLSVNNADALLKMPMETRADFLRTTARKSLARKTFDALREQLWVFGALGIGVWLSARGARPFGFRSWFIYFVAAGYIWLVVRGLIPMHLYNSFLQARAHHRWDEALAIVCHFRRLRWLMGCSVPDYDLLFTEAKACAHGGDLRGALARVQHLENDPAFDQGLYYGLLAGVYETARSWPQQVECDEKALALDPQSPTKLIGLTQSLIFRLRDASRAREVFGRIDESEVKEMARGHYEFCLGLLELEEGNAEVAAASLDRALKGLKATAGNPLTVAFTQLVSAYRALALRAAGCRSEAESLFSAARPFLETVGEVELLARWDAGV